MQENETVALSDGRTLSYAVYGEPTAKTTVFYFHTYPSSRLEGRIPHPFAKKLGIRFIVPERPGMGRSTFKPNRQLLDWPQDVLELADHLKLNKFHVLGLSGGGPYALSCLHGVGRERLLGVAIISSMYPISFDTTGMMMSTKLMFWVAPYWPGLLRVLFNMTVGRAARDPDPKKLESWIEQEISSMPLVDRKCVGEGVHKDYFIDTAREAFKYGAEGTAWEAKLYGTDWGFELKELDQNIPLSIWHGSADGNIPPSMAFHAKEMMPWAEFKMLDDEGHLSIAFTHAEQILKELVGM